MRFETLKSRKKKYFLYVLVVGVALLLPLILTVTRAKYKMTQSIPLAKGTITYELGDLNIIAMFSKNDSGIYEEISTMPTSGYHINSNETYCKVNGEVDKEIEVEVIDNKVYVSNVKEKTKCYLYFDKDTCGSACEKILADNPIKAVRTNFDQPLTTNTTGTLFQASDDDGISYYYAGAVDNNWVKFGGFYWRIIRINGDGSIRIIYSGVDSGSITDNNRIGEGTQIGSSAFNANYIDNAYIGYMYGTPGSSTYEETHANINDSTIKTYLDNWYELNLDNYNNYIDINAGFCGDRSRNTTNENWWGHDTRLGYGNNRTAYAAFGRLYNIEGKRTNAIPSLKCKNIETDLYTSENSIIGNKKLTKTIGLITSDEVILAGGFAEISNITYYLYTGQIYWTMSPVLKDTNWVHNFHIDSNGSIYGKTVSYVLGVRPIINLRTDVTLTGNGTSNDPYIIS